MYIFVYQCVYVCACHTRMCMLKWRKRWLRPVMMHFLCATHENCVQQHNTINAHLPHIDLPPLETSRNVEKLQQKKNKIRRKMGMRLKRRRAAGRQAVGVGKLTVMLLLMEIKTLAYDFMFVFHFLSCFLHLRFYECVACEGFVARCLTAAVHNIMEMYIKVAVMQHTTALFGFYEFKWQSEQANDIIK